MVVRGVANVRLVIGRVVNGCWRKGEIRRRAAATWWFTGTGAASVTQNFRDVVNHNFPGLVNKGMDCPKVTTNRWV